MLDYQRVPTCCAARKYVTVGLWQGYAYCFIKGAHIKGILKDPQEK
jgi:hypothetical protein